MEASDDDWVGEARKRLREQHAEREKERDGRRAKQRQTEDNRRRALDQECRTDHPNYETDLRRIEANIKRLVPVLKLDEILWLSFTQRAVVLSILPITWLMATQADCEEPGFPFNFTEKLVWTDPSQDRYRLLRMAMEDIKEWAQRAGLVVSAPGYVYGDKQDCFAVPFGNESPFPNRDYMGVTEALSELGADTVYVGLRVPL